MRQYDPEGRPVINWTPSLLAEFKALWVMSQDFPSNSYRFDPKDGGEKVEFDRDYAKFLIEYLSGVFK